MDWGLMRNFEDGDRKYLRKKITYHPYFYYYCMVSDLFLRLAWIFGIWHYFTEDGLYNNL